MSDSVRPHRRQPTRLPHAWDSLGKNTGVGCHFLLQCMKVKSESEGTQSCPTLRNPMDCSLPGSSIHGIFPGKSTGVGCHHLLWRSLLPCKYFHDASQLRFRALSAMLFGIISLSLVTGKVPKQFKSNCFSVTANIASRSVSHWLSYQDQSFPDSFSFLTYALTWFGSSLMVPEIMKFKIKQMKKLLLTSNQCCYSPGQGPLIFPEVSLCSDWPSAFQKS